MQTNDIGRKFKSGDDIVVFEGDKKARILTNKGFSNPCGNGAHKIEVVNDRIIFTPSTECNLADLADLEFYEYIPERVDCE